MENNIKYTDWLESHGFVLIKEEDIKHIGIIENESMKSLTKLTYQKAAEDNNIILEIGVVVSQGIVNAPHIYKHISSIVPYGYVELSGMNSVYMEPENELVQVIFDVELHCGVGNDLVDSLTLK